MYAKKNYVFKKPIMIPIRRNLSAQLPREVSFQRLFYRFSIEQTLLHRDEIGLPTLNYTFLWYDTVEY